MATSLRDRKPWIITGKLRPTWTSFCNLVVEWVWVYIYIYILYIYIYTCVKMPRKSERHIKRMHTDVYMLYTQHKINIHIYKYTCRIHTDAIIKTSEDIPLTLFERVVCVRGSWRSNKTATYWPPQPLRTSPYVVLVLLGCSTGGLGAQPLWDMFSFQHLLTNWSGLQTRWVVAFSTTSCLQLLWSPTHWFLSSPSYMIVKSPTQYLFSWLARLEYATSGVFGLACLIVIKRK